MRPETLAVHAARSPDPHTGAIAPPIHLSTTFERDADGGYSRGYMYVRNANPNREALERTIAALEGGCEAVAFASGLAAASAVIQTLSPGDHVVAPCDVYHGFRLLLNDVFARWGLRVDYVQTQEAGAVESAIKPQTRLVWIETPSNPMLHISDISAIASIAHDAGALCCCDNTFATPILQRPLDLGADLVVHSTTKWIGGHSDVQGGVVVVKSPGETLDRLRTAQRLVGGVLSPFDCWLTERGVRTLSCRVRTSTASAERIAQFLADHPRVHSVHYPTIASHPQAKLAMSQMQGGGGMISLQVQGGEEAAVAVAASVKLFTRATSLGGVESLIEHRASIEGPTSDTPVDLLRLSIGLEHPDDLIDDLRQALER